MPSSPKAALKTKAAASIAAFTVGFMFPLIFFAFNDPDRVKFTAAVIWFSICLFPSALVLSMKYSRTCFLNAIMMLCGIFIGTCVAMIAYYLDRANLFPIAAAIWTIAATIPVAFGSALGFLLARVFYRQHVKDL